MNSQVAELSCLLDDSVREGISNDWGCCISAKEGMSGPDYFDSVPSAPVRGADDSLSGLSVTNEGVKSASVKISGLKGEMPAASNPLIILIGTAARGQASLTMLSRS